MLTCPQTAHGCECRADHALRPLAAAAAPAAARSPAAVTPVPHCPHSLLLSCSFWGTMVAATLDGKACSLELPPECVSVAQAASHAKR